MDRVLQQIKDSRSQRMVSEAASKRPNASKRASCGCPDPLGSVGAQEHGPVDVVVGQEPQLSDHSAALRLLSRLHREPFGGCAPERSWRGASSPLFCGSAPQSEAVHRSCVT